MSVRKQKNKVSSVMTSSYRAGLTTKNPSAYITIRRCAKGIITTLIVELLLLILSALIFTKVDIPSSLYDTVSAIITAVALAAASYLSSKKHREKGLISGMMLGSAVFTLVLIVTIIRGETATAEAALVKLFVFLSAASIGGYVGLGNRSKIHRKTT